MYDHIGLKVRDLDASIRFYKRALAGMGYELCSSSDTDAGFGPPGAPALWLYAAKGQKTGRTHIAFRAGDSAAVDRFHRDGLEAGGTDNGGPGLRTDYAANYYAAFLIDPDGNNVEAVCMT